eukprot:Gregarina_sp_Poly_1__3497@NODE_2018_length_2848_cov_263_869831_g1303_i0_p2_GENE_NODE_2018_length_2848_cov_263_869831_g1303_i0NODE_2018_length_2848_cov_263_869831_g1303_i0_p2_ORF_typecomplete_len254_score26_97PrmC_N/PF17827_1/0_16_NODE_2018_length_2848_cov_263_869831_g1303_i0213974
MLGWQAAFADCLADHLAEKCQFKHIERFAIPVTHICLEPNLLIHAFTYDTSQITSLDNTTVPRRAGRRLESQVETRDAQLPLAHASPDSRGRRLQSSTKQDSILQIWAYLKFLHVDPSCTVNHNHWWSVNAVSAVGPYDDYACLHNPVLWNSTNYVQTRIVVEEPGTVWIELTDLPIKVLDGPAQGIQVWADLRPCYDDSVKAFEAGLQVSVVYDFMPYSQFATRRFSEANGASEKFVFIGSVALYFIAFAIG